MTLWTFFDFLKEDGANAITEWIESLPPHIRQKVAAALAARLEAVQNLENHEWPEGWFTDLSGYSGIVEVKFKVKKVQYRPLGCYGPGRHQFTLLVGAIEKGDKFVPRSAPNTANDRRKIVQKDRSRIREHE